MHFVRYMKIYIMYVFSFERQIFGMAGLGKGNKKHG